MPEGTDRVSLADLIGFDDDLVEQGFNATADANASLPPVPADDYVVKVRFSRGSEPGKEWEPRVTESGQSYLRAMAEAEIVEGEYEGRVVYAFISTLVSKSRKTNSVQALAQGSGHGDEFAALPNQSAKSQAIFISDLLRSEPLCGASIDWQVFQKAEESADGKAFQRTGMKKFPKDAEGNYIPFWTREDNSELKARNVIQKWFAVSAEVAQQVDAAPAPVQAKAATAPASTVVKSAPVATAPAPAPAPAPRPRATATRRS